MGEVREGGFQVKSALACVGSNDLRRALRDAVLKVIHSKYYKQLAYILAHKNKVNCAMK